MKEDTLLPLNEGWSLLDGLVSEAERNYERLTSFWKHTPPVGEVRRPVIIAGPYRTGTTYLHRFLSEVFNFRTLKGWESTIPTEGDPEKLIKDAQAGIDVLYELQPDLKEMHEEGALLPAECVRAMAMTGITGLWPAIAPCPAYREFLFETEATGAYQFYDRCLRTLDPQANWLLKSPMHSLFLDEIAEVWPDALVVRINRQSSEAVVSAIRFFATLRALSKPGNHHYEVAQWIEGYLKEHSSRVDRSPLEVIEVSTYELRQKPLLVAAKIGRSLNARVYSH